MRYLELQAVSIPELISACVTALNITFFKTGQVVRLKQRYFKQSDFQTEHQTKPFFEETQDIKSLANNLELLCLDKYKT